MNPIGALKVRRSRGLRAALLAFGVGLTSCSGCSSCGKKKDDAPINPVVLPGNATPTDIGTKVGNGRVIEVGQVTLPTSAQWTRVYPLDKTRLVVAGREGSVGDAYALITNDRGASWKAHTAKADGIVTWSVGVDGTVVLAIGKRAIPAKPPPPGQLPPIDTLTFLFAAPDQPKITTPALFIAPAAPDAKEKNPTVPRGDGLPAVLGPAIASVVVELKPKSYAIAYVLAPGEASLPNPIELPKGEVPVNAPFGHPPQLLTTNGKNLLVRPWPGPTASLAEPKVVDKINLTKTIEDELSQGPECEWGPWSFKRVTQDKGVTMLLGISPERIVTFQLPPTITPSPLGCNDQKVVVEYIHEEDKLTRIASCTLDGVCTQPRNRAFLKPWPETQSRALFLAPTPAGMVSIQQVRSRVKWSVDLGVSKDNGINFIVPTPIGEGEGGNPEDGYGIGTLVPMGERTLLLMSAKVAKTPRRSWYALASDDNGDTWTMP